MESLLLILLLLAVAAAVAPLLRGRAARRRRLAQLALARGWTYSPTDPWDLVRRIQGTWLGAWGHDRRCGDVFSVPLEAGALWLGQFARQMASGRRRRSECYALAVARPGGSWGGIAILPAAERFAPADPFVRYRKVGLGGEPGAPERVVWAERPISEAALIAQLAALLPQLPRLGAIEARADTAIVYWPTPRGATEQDFLNLAAVARGLVELLRRPEAEPAEPSR